MLGIVENNKMAVCHSKDAAVVLGRPSVENSIW
jgi:hypothetical protein